MTASGVTDGPFVEAKEIVGGYMIVAAESYERALEVATGRPGDDDAGIEHRDPGDRGPLKTPGLVEHFFRHEYGRLVAMLARRVGRAALELVEDAVQIRAHGRAHGLDTSRACRKTRAPGSTAWRTTA